MGRGMHAVLPAPHKTCSIRQVALQAGCLARQTTQAGTSEQDRVEHPPVTWAPGKAASSARLDSPVAAPTSRISCTGRAPCNKDGKEQRQFQSHY